MAARAKVDQWLFYGSATFTTLSQQFGHWVVRNPEKVPPAQKHYDAVLRDMLGTLTGIWRRTNTSAAPIRSPT